MDDIDSAGSPTPSDEDGTNFPTPGRRDGWTPFARRLFLSVLAETGRVSRACNYAQLSTQSAYALRHRDVLFAAGWDAACAMAREPLADALYEQAVDGVTETIRRDGEIIAERHRLDSRLSIAVLYRLDKRCDLAEERGARHLPLIRRWDEWLDLIGKGDDVAARAMLGPADPPHARDHQLHQLPLGENPIGSGDVAPNQIVYGQFWQDGEGRWMTNYPPPPDFDGDQHCRWGDHSYGRGCSAEEAAMMERLNEADLAKDLAAAAAARDACLADMAAEIAILDGLPEPIASA